jgi:DNA-3-methyladenine glycosylase I
LKKEKQRCSWTKDEQMNKYHDTEWGMPLHDDRKIFEFIILDAFQAGLSWAIVLKKRKSMEKAFRNFDPKKVAKFTQKDVNRLMGDAGIIRNRLKIQSAVTNAQRFLEVQKEFGTFDKYIWQFVGHKPKVNKFHIGDPWLARSKESDAMSKDLMKRGFKFVGSTICYAFMQAAGMINDHRVECFRHKQLAGKK